MNELSIAIPYAGWSEALFPNLKDSVKAFEFVKENGIEAIDFSLDLHLSSKQITTSDKGDFFTKSVEELFEYYAPVKDALEKTGMRLCQAHAPFPLYRRTDAEYNEYIVEMLEKCIAICGYLGIPAIVAHPISYADKSVEKAANLWLYRRLIPAAKKYGVMICLENLFLYMANHLLAGTCCEAEETIEYIDTLNAEAGEEIFGFCFDLGHANVCGVNVRDFIRKMGKRITLLHLHDNDGINDMHRSPMTIYQTDWDGLIEGLRDINYRGPLDFETATVFYKCENELIPANIRYMVEVGKYIRKRLLEE